MLKRMRSFLVVVMLLITATMSAQVTTASMSGKVTAQDEPILEQRSLLFTSPPVPAMVQ